MTGRPHGVTRYRHDHCHCDTCLTAQATKNRRDYDHQAQTQTVGPRGTCPVCGRERYLRTDGTISRHNAAPRDWTNPCPGTWQPPAEVTRR